jgi:nucleoid-associated protein YgaU
MSTKIKVGSRYYTSDIDYIQLTEKGNQLPIVGYSFGNLGKIKYQTHVFVEGDRLDAIAFHYYNKPSLWWLIAQFNPKVVNINNITPGTELIIPNV